MAFATRCMEGVVKIPYKTFVDFVSISPTPPHPALQIGKQEESKREKRDTKVVGEVPHYECVLLRDGHLRV
jgi:hypothetical protein